MAQQETPARGKQRPPRWTLIGVLRWVVRTVGAYTSAGLVALVRGYQLFVSPLLGPRCRFYPSCSTYAIQALRRHGPLRGLVLASWRLLRCNPWNRGGIDPVPPRRVPARHGHGHEHLVTGRRGA